jgi:ATP-binding cassette subfamily B protein
VTQFIKKTRQTLSTSFRLTKILWRFDRGIFLGNLLVVSVPAVVPFINAFIYKQIIDNIIASVSGAPFSYTNLYILLGTRIFTLFFQDASFTLQRHLETLVWTKFPIYLYQEVLGKISSLDVQYFENSEFKNRLEKVKDSYSWKPQNLISNLFDSFQGVLQLGIALSAIITLNWYLLIPIAITAMIGLFVQAKTAEVAWGIWSNQSPYRKKYWYLSELIQSGHNIKEIKIFGLASKFLDELGELYTRFAKENTAQANNQLGKRLFINLVNIATYASIEIYVILSAIAKRISIGDITYYTTVITSFQSGLNGLFRNISFTYDNSLYVKDIFDLADTMPILPQPENGIILKPNHSPRIEFKNITFRYPEAKKATLKNFSMVIEPGQKVALVGENGAGKSTIIKLLARFYDVNSGEILIDGHNIKELDQQAWHRSLGILFQDFIKYEYSLSDNIYFGKVFDKKTDAEILKAAEDSGASLVAKSLPEKYNQMLGKTFEGGVELSVGQWQKVALARAFLRNSPVLILDEPTAAIDAKAEYEIFEKVEKLSKDKTVVIISHRFSTVRNADKIYVIEDGNVIESGSHEKLLKEDGTYAKLFHLQARGYK